MRLLQLFWLPGVRSASWLPPHRRADRLGSESCGALTGTGCLAPPGGASRHWARPSRTPWANAQPIAPTTARPMRARIPTIAVMMKPPKMKKERRKEGSEEKEREEKERRHEEECSLPSWRRFGTGPAILRPAERRQSHPAEQPVLLPSGSSELLPRHQSRMGSRSESATHRSTQPPTAARSAAQRPGRIP